MSLLHWQRTGPAGAPVLVLLNSVGASSQMWRAQLAPLAEQLQVVEVDTRGHGQSPPAPPGAGNSIADLAAEVLEVIDELGDGAGRVHLAGLSLGGMIALWLAAHHPDRVDRLAVLCSSAYLEPLQLWTDRAAAVRAAGTASIAAKVVSRWVTPELAERDPELIGWLQAMLGEVDDESYAQCCEAIAGMDQRADLGRIGAPTLVIAGAQDPATPLAQARLIAEGIGGAQLRVLSPAAHLATIEAAGQVNSLLLAHFRPSRDQSARTEGERTRRQVLGEAYVDRQLDQVGEFARPFQEFITSYAWGEVWSRPGLGRRERSMVTVTALATLGAEHELELHLRAALGNGVSPDELRELLLQLAIYASVPRANRAFAIAARVLDSD
ncbi:MAG: alpha/beta fold hydrolase [Jatrophihabitantaceae bacterium]